MLAPKKKEIIYAFNIANLKVLCAVEDPNLRGQGQALKKIKGRLQGPTFRGQILLRPRT